MKREGERGRERKEQKEGQREEIEGGVNTSKF